jgi:hypothetical protein
MTSGSYWIGDPKGDNEVTVTTPEIAQNPSLGGTVLHCDVGYADNKFDIEIPPK